jgi:RNA polymerase sigma factor (sigma-70 family)
MRREQTNDCEIWSQFKNGDKKAFASLYQLHSEDLICYGSKICNEQEILKDAIQDLFVELWHSRKNLAPVDSVRFYLLKSLRYKLIRSEKKRLQQNSFLPNSTRPGFARFDMPVESAIIEKETQDSQVRILRKAIKSLSKRQQEVIQLRFYQGFSNDQIAQLMHMNYQSVSNLIYNALSRIKNNLKTAVFASALSIVLYLFF